MNPTEVPSALDFRTRQEMRDEIKQLKEDLRKSLDQCERSLSLAEKREKIVEKLLEWYAETKLPLPEGHIPIVSLGGIRAKLKEILEA